MQHQLRVARYSTVQCGNKTLHAAQVVEYGAVKHSTALKRCMQHKLLSIELAQYSRERRVSQSCKNSRMQAKLLSIELAQYSRERRVSRSCKNSGRGREFFKDLYSERAGVPLPPYATYINGVLYLAALSAFSDLGEFHPWAC